MLALHVGQRYPAHQLEGLVSLTDVLTSIVGDLPSSDSPYDQNVVEREEPFQGVEARYSAFQLQSYVFAPHLRERLRGIIPEPGLGRVSDILVEAFATAGDGPRPVCAVYYNNWFLGGDGKVVLAEFKAAWSGRD